MYNRLYYDLDDTFYIFETTKQAERAKISIKQTYCSLIETFCKNEA